MRKGGINSWNSSVAQSNASKLGLVNWVLTSRGISYMTDCIISNGWRGVFNGKSPKIDELRMNGRRVVRIAKL